MLSRLNVSYRVHLPASVVQFLQTLAYLEIFEFTAFFGGLHCLVSNFSYIERVYVQSISAAIVLAVLGAVAVLAGLFPVRLQRSDAGLFEWGMAALTTGLLVLGVIACLNLLHVFRVQLRTNELFRRNGSMRCEVKRPTD